MEPADQGDVCSGSRLCENVQGQRMRRIVFSVGFSRQWSPALLVFKSTKSRWNFYKKILRGSFHTASTQTGLSQPIQPETRNQNFAPASMVMTSPIVP